MGDKNPKKAPKPKKNVQKNNQSLSSETDQFTDSVSSRKKH